MDALAYFPYVPRQSQKDALRLAMETFAKSTVGMLSADCGVGKTISALSGFLAARNESYDFNLLLLTRTHSQSRVFEEEITVLREKFRISHLTSTTMVSRGHVCPIRNQIEGESNRGFLRACGMMIRSHRCSHYWDFYSRSREEGKAVPSEFAMIVIESLLDMGVVNVDRIAEHTDAVGMCPYEVLRWCARKSRVVIGPYSYLFKERVRKPFLASLHWDLPAVDVVVDEAHNLPDHVLEAETAKLTGAEASWLISNKVMLVKETGIEWLGEAIDFVWNTFLSHADELFMKQKEVVLRSWDVVPRFMDRKELEALLSRTEVTEIEDSIPTETPLDRFVELLFSGVRAGESDDWHITLEEMHRWKGYNDIADTKIVIRPLNAAGIIAPVLRTARASLLMSGTLRPTSLYSRLMGVQGALEEDITSPFPRGSRMVLLEQELSTKYTERGTDLWRKIAGRIETALQAMPAEKSALIAFPSYNTMQQVLSFNIDTGYRQRVVEERGAKIEELMELIIQKPCAIFLVFGGKFSEGVDLVQDGRSLVDLIIGVGIPFSPPTRYQQALQEWYDKRFGEGTGYYYSSVVPSIRKVVQLIGRLRRSPEDSGVVMLVDRRFGRHIKMFGKGIESDLWPYKTDEEIRYAIKMFNQLRQESVRENGTPTECLGC